MLFGKHLLICLGFHALGGVGVAAGQKDWYSRIRQDFSSETFPLRKCKKKMNEAPTNGTRCGRMSKTCFFGDQICNEGLPYPTVSCMCNGTKSFRRGIWNCQPRACPGGGTGAGGPGDGSTGGSSSGGGQGDCGDAALEEGGWINRFGVTCKQYEIFEMCVKFGGDASLDRFGFSGNQACCACGGGVVDLVKGTCRDEHIQFDPPVGWFDSVGDNCSWYAESPQDRCVDFSNEENSYFGLSVTEACCACANLEPPANDLPSSCTDLTGWTIEGDRTCSDVTKRDCQENTENWGVSVTDACCKCGARATNQNAPTDLVLPAEPVTAGGCEADSTKFDICIKVAPNIAPQDVDVLSSAGQRWSSIIVGDSPDFRYDFGTINTSGFNPRNSGENVTDLPAFYKGICGYDPGFPSVTDDINVCIGQKIMLSGVLAEAAPVIGDNFTRFGYIGINSDRVSEIREKGEYEDIVVYQLGRVLGVGFQWPIDQAGCTYIGKNANRVYQEISGCSSEKSLPLETPGDSRSCGRYLSESCFPTESMAFGGNGGLPRQLSTLSVSLMEDLGYTVDYSQTEASLTQTDLGASCVCNDEGPPNTSNRKLEKQQDDPITQLSSEVQANITEYAKQKLRKMNQNAASFMTSSENSNHGVVAIPGLAVVCEMEDGTIHTVYVANEEEEDVGLEPMPVGDGIRSSTRGAEW